MQAEKLHVNEQLQIFRELHNKRLSFTNEELRVIFMRDNCRREHLQIVNCCISKNILDKFILVKNNLGFVSLVDYSGKKKSTQSINELRINRQYQTTSNFSMQENSKILCPSFDICYFSAMETVALSGSSLVFLTDNQLNLNLFTKEYNGNIE